MTTEEEITKAFFSKKDFFDSGFTKTYEFRVAQLKKLRLSIQKFESDITEALHKDLHKPEMEAYISEVGIIYNEIEHTLRHLKRWMRPKRKRTPVILQPSVSKVYPQPLGVVLIIGPWNYPFFLLMAPLVGAIAAGNCAIIKPSDNTKNTSEVVKKIITSSFDESFISVVTGPGAMVGPQLIEKYPFNHIFFTGSPGVGKQVMAMAAKQLTPVTLELGGKSPAIVDKSADLAIAAKRIIWGKCFNAGQTCISPDYLIVHEDVKDRLVSKMITTLAEFYGEKPLESEHLTYIVNEKRYNTLVSYLEGINILYGGNYDPAKKVIEPTLADQVPENHPLRTDEIFGPILPIYTFRDNDEIVGIVRKARYPLACYIFTKSKDFERFIISNIEFGGGSINNTLSQYANQNLPFGGIGNSGIGMYHGRYSFEVFSHYMSMVKSSTFIDPEIKYPPYSKNKLTWIKKIMNL